MNDYWHTISAMADRATRETGKTVTPDDVFNLARQGVVRVGANIPGWKCAGNGELAWHYPDGSQVGGFDFSDGVARWLDEDQLDTLVRRGEVSLAGTRWPVPGGPTLTAGGPKGSPHIKRDDLRVPEDEYPRILAAIDGEPSAPREIAGTAPTPARCAAEPWWHLIQQHMELNEHIAEVGKARSNLQQSKQDLAILREELAHLETTPEFLSAVESFVAALKRQFEPIAKSDQQDLIEQRAAEIEYWSALLARLRLPASNKQHDSDRTSDEASADNQDNEKPVKRRRMNKKRAFLKHCVEKEGLTDIDSIWLYIRATAGKSGFLFEKASKDQATTIDKEPVKKQNLERQLSEFLKMQKNGQATD